MLDVNEQGLAVRGFAQASDFAVFRADQEALERFGRLCLAYRGGHAFFAAVRAFVGQGLLLAVTDLAGQGGQHHAVCLVGVSTVVGLDPADASGGAERQAVGCGHVVFFGQAREVHAGGVCVGFGSEHIDVPTESSVRGLGLGYTDDVAVHIAFAFFGALHVRVGAGVGCVHTHLTVYHTIGVVGERHVELAIARVDAAPLRAVHLGGTHRISCQAGEHGNVGFAGEGKVRVGSNIGVVEREFQPLAGAVGLELGHIQRALVEVLAACCQAVGGHGIRCVPLGRRHVLVHIFAARVVAHIGHHWLAHHRCGKAHAFVRDAAQCGALTNEFLWVVGIHFHHVAEGI